jgi:hypothetical protein
MFINTPKVLAHVSSLNDGNFVTPDYILNKDNDFINLFHRFCPHRMYPLQSPGEVVQNIKCKFHGFEWDNKGIPINNEKKLNCGLASLGKSGLIFRNFTEPNHQWVEDLSKEKTLRYSHSNLGHSKGSWLWLMDAEADLLHLYKGGIHPFLSKQINLDDIELDQGDGWIIQNHPGGWWLYIFPYVFVEYGNPGMLMVNSVYPKNADSEFEFDWITQFYYDNNIDVGKRLVFETLEKVFEEDVATAELQKGPYFPLMKAMNKYENHCVHFGKWFSENRKK